MNGGCACDYQGKTRARLGVFGNRPLRRGAFGEGRARLPALRRDPGPGRLELFLFLRDLPGRGGAGGAPADAPLQALLREEPALAGRPARAPLRQEPGTLRRRLALTFTPGRKAEEDSHALRVVLLALHTRTRRVCPACAGGRRRGIRGRGPSPQARWPWYSRADALPGKTLGGAPPVRATFPESRPPGNRANRQYPAVSRPAPRPRAEKRGERALGAPVAAHDRRFGRRGPRHPPSDLRRPLL